MRPEDISASKKRANLIAGALAVGLPIILATFIWHASAYHTRSTDDARRHAQDYAESADASIQRACRSAEPAALVECVGKQIAATREDQRAEYDLSAQDRMAEWAFWMMAAAVFTTALTAVALWFIKGTLDATRQAVHEAQSAVTETSRIGEAQVRAYLSVIGMNYTAKPKKAQMLPSPEIELVLNNSGATPAINIAHYCGCGVATHFAARTFECPDIVPFTMRLPIMPANATGSRDSWCHGILNRVSEYKTAELLVTQDTKFGNMPRLLIWGSVFYDDVFGASHRSDYAFVVDHRDDLVGHALSVAEAPQRCFQPIRDRRAVVQKAED